VRVGLLYQQRHRYIRGEIKCFQFHIARCGSGESWYPARYLLKLGIDERQKARDVGGEHNDSSISHQLGNYLHAVAFPVRPMICSSSAFVALFQVLGRRLELTSQFGKGLLYVNVAGRVCELRTFFGSLKIFLRR